MPLYLLHEFREDGECSLWVVAATSPDEAALLAAEHLLEEEQVHRHMDRIRIRDGLLARFTSPTHGPIEVPEADLPPGVYYTGPASL